MRTKHFDVNFITETSSLRQLQRKTLSSAASVSSWAVMAAWHERWTRCFGLLSVCSFTLRSSIRRDSKPTSKYDTHTSLAKRTFVKESTESKQAKERARVRRSQQQALTTTTTQHTTQQFLQLFLIYYGFPFVPAFRVYWTSLIISQSRCCCCCFCCSIIVHLERQFCCCCCFCLCWLHGSRPGLIAAAWISTQKCSLHWDATSANCFVATSGRSSAKFKTFEVFFCYWGARKLS